MDKATIKNGREVEVGDDVTLKYEWDMPCSGEILAIYERGDGRVMLSLCGDFGGRSMATWPAEECE